MIYPLKGDVQLLVCILSMDQMPNHNKFGLKCKARTCFTAF